MSDGALGGEPTAEREPILWCCTACVSGGGDGGGMVCERKRVIKYSCLALILVPLIRPILKLSTIL